MFNRTQVLLLIVILGCAGSIKSPKWFNKMPQKKGFVYAAGSATSDRRESALSQASDIAAAKIAKQLQVESETVNKQVLEEVSDKTVVNVWTGARNTMMAQSIQGLREVQSEVKTSGKRYEAFVLVELNLVAAQERMLAELEKDAQVMKKLRKADLIQEMEENITAYRARRGY